VHFLVSEVPLYRPWEFEFHFPGSLISTFLGREKVLYRQATGSSQSMESNPSQSLYMSVSS